RFGPAQLLLLGVGEIEIVDVEDAQRRGRVAPVDDFGPFLALRLRGGLDLGAEIDGDGDHVDHAVPEEADVGLRDVHVVHGVEQLANVAAAALAEVRRRRRVADDVKGDDVYHTRLDDDLELGEQDGVRFVPGLDDGGARTGAENGDLSDDGRPGR